MPPPFWAAVLLLTMMSEMVSPPAFEIPPPFVFEFPFVTVSELMVATELESTSKTLDELFPETLNLLEPGPVIVMWELSSSTPLVRVVVQGALPVNWVVSTVMSKARTAFKSPEWVMDLKVFGARLCSPFYFEFNVT
jgi:hypothetical protein